MRTPKRVMVYAVALVAVATVSARGDSWFRANPEVVKRYSQELTDTSRPVEERLSAVTGLRVLLTVYGAYNFDPAVRALQKIRREPDEVGAAAERLFTDVRRALSRADKRLPNAPVVTGPW